MSDRALYYPHIHIRDIEWLKGTLLLFSQVKRMTPVPGAQPDDGNIETFTKRIGGREPMVGSADLWSTRAVTAQQQLAVRLKADAIDPHFKAKYGKKATEAAHADTHGFQIHQAKLHDDLKAALGENGFAWKPGVPEPYDRWLQYVELNPRIGEAVMSTLAIACAKGEGLDVVGDSRTGQLHEFLISKDANKIYDAWLHPREGIPDPLKPNAQDLFEFVVTVACDTSKIEPDGLAKIGANREPIQRLMKALQEKTENMVAMDDGPRRKQQFMDETQKILTAWRQDRANMDAYWKAFFGFGVLDEGQKLIDKVIDKALVIGPPAVVGGEATQHAAGLPWLAWSAAFGIGIAMHGAKIRTEVRKKDRDSPYRYLTLIEKAGVVIRTDVRDAG